MYSKRTRKYYRIVSVTLALLLLTQTLAPTVSYALTAGPSQPEVQAFTPIGTSDMVNVSSGDFNYNIPLLDVGGYPINLAYNAGSGMEDEASWVGLGWNINPGVIKRNMRGLPDDFNGDKVKKEYNIKDNKTFGLTVGLTIEPFGVGDDVKVKPKVGLNFGLGVNYNNYTGVGVEVSASPSLSMSLGSSSSIGIGLGVSLSASTQGGTEVSPNVSLSYRTGSYKDSNLKLGLSVGISYNSRQGLRALTMSPILDLESKGTNKKTKEDDQSSKSFGGIASASISFSSPTYTPYADMPTENISYYFSAALSGELFHIKGGVSLSGNYAKQTLASRTRDLSGYGYMYSQEATDPQALLDFNREKDGAFLPETPNLPLTNFSYDIYSVSGQGVGGMYRLHRTDIGVLHNPLTEGRASDQLNIGAELGVGNAVKIGANLQSTKVDTRDGVWDEENSMNSALAFNGKAYFKAAGEMTRFVAEDQYNMLGAEQPIAMNLDNTAGIKMKYSGAADLNTGALKRNQTSKKEKRTQTISSLTIGELKSLGNEKKQHSYGSFDYDLSAHRYNDTTAVQYSADINHHVGEITATRADGSRYVYGLPAYNNTQREVTFAISSGATINYKTGLVSYSTGDNSLGNQNGLDHFFERVTTPAFAHSYLLTSILSADYVDRTQNGVTDDDYGSYTKINYSKSIPDYKWRMPYEENKASYNEGLKSNLYTQDVADDKGNYLYGTKDVWYVHSIETRTHIAEFVLEDREDGYEVKGENGGRDGSCRSTKLLKEIRLYAKPQKYYQGISNTLGAPIKVVHFLYDYSLCKGVPNNKNGNGKLTLKEVFFTYGTSGKARYSSYKFTYANNIDYDAKAIDRWGTFKLNMSGDNDDLSNPLSNAEFPYTDQSDREQADMSAAAWCLNKIDLPSGGSIHVTYESDDYAFVQDKPAMKMVKVVGAYNENIASPDKIVPYLTTIVPPKIPNHKILVEVPQDYSTADFRDKMLKGMQNIYFRFLINIDKKVSFSTTPPFRPEDGKYEYVSGYAPINIGGSGVMDIGGHKYGVVALQPINVKGHEYQRISMAAWQYGRMYLPRVVYNQPSDNQFTVLAAIEALASALGSVEEMIEGYNNKLNRLDHGKEFAPTKSWIRLYEPTGFKIGGGHRVKKIELSDEWNDLLGQNNPQLSSSYGQEYDYTTSDDPTANELGSTAVRYSSGVAGYEPLLGGDENPFKQPKTYSDEKWLIPATEHLMEYPFGESFFPSAGITYSKVTVKNLARPNVTYTATGKVVNEFFTSKDYPVLTDQTTIDVRRDKSNGGIAIFKINKHDLMTASQGYVIELNDMDGKPKATTVYNEAGKAISSVEYKYKQADRDIKYIVPKLSNGFTVEEVKTVNKKWLSNNVLFATKNKGLEDGIIGLDYEVTYDCRETSSLTDNTGLNVNFDMSMYGVIPFPLPIPIPALGEDKTRMRMAMFTKIINRYGVLEETVAKEDGATVSTKNLVYDEETGEVLLTETSNQYGDPIYSFTYPAHWAYEGMAGAYQNLDEELNGSLNSNSDRFYPGDEVLTSAGKVWIRFVSSGNVTAIDKDGKIITSNTTAFKIVRSGRRNMQSTPVGTVTTLINPIRVVGSSKQLVFDKVINAGAVEFSQAWRTYCAPGAGYDPSGVNPYLQGLMGNWRMVRSWVHLTERTQEIVNENTSIRSDGIFKSFTPFWNSATNGDWGITSAQWQFTSEVTEYSPFGQELENKDALMRYSNAYYGYNSSLPISVSNNARRSDVIIENFEDIYSPGWKNADDRSTSFSSTEISSESHTGRKSLSIGQGGTVIKRITINPCAR